MSEPHIRVFATPEELVEQMAAHIANAAEAAAKEGRMFSLFLSGGSTPKALHKQLAADPYKSQIDWRAVELFFGDERCVPPDSDLSNYKMAKETLIDRVPIPPDNVYRMKGEIDPEQAAKEYGELLRDKFQGEGPDILLLGMGDDGHTASLFPGTKALDEQKHRCVANHVPYDYIPKGTEWRITLTYPFINRSREIFVLCTGVGKAKRVAEVLEEVEEHQFPIQRVEPTDGKLTWMLDAAAAGMAGE